MAISTFLFVWGHFLNFLKNIKDFLVKNLITNLFICNFFLPLEACAPTIKALNTPQPKNTKGIIYREIAIILVNHAY